MVGEPSVFYASFDNLWTGLNRSFDNIAFGDTTAKQYGVDWSYYTQPYDALKSVTGSPNPQINIKEMEDAIQKLINSHGSTDITLPSYPKSRCELSKDSNKLRFTFALAGFKKDQIRVTAEKTSLRVWTVTPEEEETDWVQVANNLSSKDVDFTITVDKKFNTAKAEVKFGDGILEVVIPKHKKAEATTLTIN